MMRATEAEFRARFWFIGGIFWLGFFCYIFDHQNAGIAVGQLLWRRAIDPNSASSARPLHAVFAFAALLCVLCGLIRTWAAACLRSAVVHDQALHSENLVADGPYRRVRNPLYLGGVLLAAGIGFLASRTGWFVMTFGLLFFYYRLIFREEASLNASQGQSFRDYCAAVPRFLPALFPRVPPSGAKPRWGQAFAGEMFIWGFTAGVVIFAITLNEALCWIITGASFVIYLGYWLVSSHLARRSATS